MNRRRLFVSIASMLASACVPSVRPRNHPYLIRIVPPGSIGGRALFIHGLNSQVTVLEPLARTFAALGFAGELEPLPGHRSNFTPDGTPLDGAAEWLNLDADCWRRETDLRLERLRTSSRGLTTVAVGYSLGCALILDSLRRNPALRPSKIVLLAPAIIPRALPRLVEALTPARLIEGWLPSFGPEGASLYSGTSLAAYRALFDVVESIEDAEAVPGWSDSKALVVYFEGDELIDNERCERWIRRRSLPWRSITVTPHETPRHLGILPDILGEPSRLRLEDEIRAFIDA